MNNHVGNFIVIKGFINRFISDHHRCKQSSHELLCKARMFENPPFELPQYLNNILIEFTNSPATYPIIISTTNHYAML